mgnify:CR=1 FL=1
MKKLFIVAVMLLLTSPCFADRIADLKAQQESLLKEVQAGQQYIQSKQVEALKIQGAIEELERAKTQPEVKE